eukprot:Filipodium_phascolosomae@DN1958_c0_g1_i1.p1
MVEGDSSTVAEMKKCRAELMEELGKLESRISSTEDKYFEQNSQRNLVEGFDSNHPTGGRKISASTAIPSQSGPTARFPSPYIPTKKIFSYSSLSSPLTKGTC